MKEGEVALARLPQANGATKPRPVLVLRQMPPFGDWLVCGISSQLHQSVANFDDVIDGADADFTSTGLKGPSLIRLGFLAVLPAAYFLGVIGSVEPARHDRVLLRLSDHLRP
jgi:mRNA interferase MazF